MLVFLRHGQLCSTGGVALEKTEATRHTSIAACTKEITSQYLLPLHTSEQRAAKKPECPTRPPAIPKSAAYTLQSYQMLGNHGRGERAEGALFGEALQQSCIVLISALLLASGSA